MAVGKTRKSASKAALATALTLALAAIAGTAQARPTDDDGPRRGNWSRSADTVAAPQQDNSGGNGWRGERAERSTPAPQAQPQVQAQAQASSQPRWSGGDQTRQWRQRENGTGGAVAAPSARNWAGRTADAQRDHQPDSRTWQRDRNDGADTRRDWERRNTAGNDSRERSYADPRRNGTYRTDNDRWRDGNDRWRDGNDRWRDGNDRWRDGNDRWRDGNDRWRSDANRYASRNDWNRNDGRRWDRDWRRNDRYNWSSWRNSHRDSYRLSPYYAPYRGYSYRRLSIGFTLDSLFFSSRYWINDPWSYRLPDAYGPYRWVRYYDDALLVDIYSGQVVDVIHDFFW